MVLLALLQGCGHGHQHYRSPVQWHECDNHQTFCHKRSVAGRDVYILFCTL